MKVLVLLGLCAVLGGCGTSGESEETQKKRGMPLDIESQGRIMGNTLMPINAVITTFKLEDGTRCAIYRWKGGIDCDWASTN